MERWLIFLAFSFLIPISAYSSSYARDPILDESWGLVTVRQNESKGTPPTGFCIDTNDFRAPTVESCNITHNDDNVYDCELTIDLRDTS